MAPRPSSHDNDEDNFVFVTTTNPYNPRPRDLDTRVRRKAMQKIATARKERTNGEKKKYKTILRSRTMSPVPNRSDTPRIVSSQRSPVNAPYEHSQHETRPAAVTPVSSYRSDPGGYSASGYSWANGRADEPADQEVIVPTDQRLLWNDLYTAFSVFNSPTPAERPNVHIPTMASTYGEFLLHPSPFIHTDSWCSAYANDQLPSMACQCTR